jgi:citronellyl-CoA synthetase
MPNPDTSNTDIISFRQFVSKLPVFLTGIPDRAKGMYIASRKNSDKPVGLAVCLEKATKRNPNGVALIFEDRELSYKEFNAWVNRFADSLAKMGAKKGDVIAVFIENRPELLACIAAISKIGGVSALLNTSQRGGVLKHSIELVKPTCIIVGEELFSAVRDVEEVLPKGKNAKLYLSDCDTLSDKTSAPAGWIDFAEKARSAYSQNPISSKDQRAAEPFCYFYTSGTTGLPKAAILTHGRFMKAYGGVGLASIQLKPSDRAFVTLPFYHGTALIIGWGSVLAGAAGLVMARQFSASKFWPEIRRTGVTAFCYVGELCRYLLAQAPSVNDQNHQVRMMFGNGLRPNLWREFKSRFNIPRVMEFYGSSEGNIGFLNLFNHDCTVGFTTIPYAIVEYDLDLDDVTRQKNGFLQKVKKGQSGLLLGEITDKSPFDGYTDPEKTEKSILRDVFKLGDAWFNTGDLMRDQGYLHAQFVDRLGDTYRWKGENVSTTEVENCISSLPSILDAVVYGVEIPNTNGRAGMASIRLTENVQFDPIEFFQHLNKQLPAFSVPVFLRISQQMETTGTFKYKKTDLKKAGFDLAKVTDPVWVCLPNERCYQLMDDSLQKSVEKGEFRY